MERIWLNAYPLGVPADIDETRLHSLADLLEESFERYASKRAFICMGRALTYSELAEKSRDFGAWLQSRGLERGARVAVMLPNVLQYPVVMAGILRAGYVIVNVNPLYTPRELEHQLIDSGAQAIILLDAFDSVLRAVQRATRVTHVVVTSMAEMMGMPYTPASGDTDLPPRISLDEALREGAAMAFRRPEINPDGIAVLQYRWNHGGIEGSDVAAQEPRR